MPAKYSCPNCNNPVVKARWEAGYQYCKSPDCFVVLGKRVIVHESPPDPSMADLSTYSLEDIDAAFNSD